MNAKTSKLRKKLNDKRYRDAFVGSQISVGIPFQVRALRKKLGLEQKDLAARTGMAQPRISAIETPGVSNLNLKTLRRLASAFDVGLIVRFAPFSELIRFSDEFSPDEFAILDFAADMAATFDDRQPDTSNVVSIFTGKTVGLTSKSDDSAPQAGMTRRPPMNAKRLDAPTHQSAVTKAEYREVGRA